MSISIRLHTHVEGMDSIEVLAWSLGGGGGGKVMVKLNPNQLATQLPRQSINPAVQDKLVSIATVSQYCYTVPSLHANIFVFYSSLPPSLPPSLLPSLPPSFPPSLLPSLPPSLPLSLTSGLGPMSLENKVRTLWLVSSLKWSMACSPSP